MVDDPFYYQCKMKQDNAYTVGWINQRGAVVGYHVELPEFGGFWEVLEVYNPPLKQSAVFKKIMLNRHSLGSLDDG